MRRAWIALAAALLVAGTACSTGGVDTAGAWRSSASRPLAGERVAVSLASAGTSSLIVKVTGGPAGRPPQVFVDSDDDRSTGMWTLQSPLSASGWDLLVDGEGRLFRHDGAQNAWRWRRLDVPGFRRTMAGGHLDLSIPGSLLKGSPFRVRVAAEAAGDWSPAAFLPGVAFPPEAPAVSAREARPPAPLSIYYGPSPWLVRDCRPADPNECATRAFSQFAHVVLVSGLEERTHPNHARARLLIQELRAVAPNTEVWGYVSLIGGPARRGVRPVIHSIGDIRERAVSWQAMGATGIFLDEADLCRPQFDSCPVDTNGDEFEVTRARQIAAVDAVHALGMPVFANAFAVPEVLGTIDGTASPLTGGRNGRAADMYLLENLTVSAGKRVSGFDAQVGNARLELALRLAAGTGIRLAAVDTVDGPAPDLAAAPAAYREGLALATKAGLEAYGFTNSSYSSEPRSLTNLALPVGAVP